MKRITQQDIDAARNAAKTAKGYEAAYAAQHSLKALLAAYDEQQAADAGLDLDERVAVVGNTYHARRTLKAAGLMWQAGRRAWVGTRRQVADCDLPSGVQVVSLGMADLRSMDHADSMV